MKEKDKVLQALCDGLGENYKLMEIDLELCIYRNFGNRFEVEVSGVHTAKQNKKATSNMRFIIESQFKSSNIP